MAAMRVLGPDGNEWRLRRKWAPRRVRWRGPGDGTAIELLNGADFLSLADDLPAVGVIVAAIAVAAFVIAALVFVVPALVFLAELLLVVLALLLGAFGRVLFRRPWTIEAHEPGADHVYEWKVVGWQASGDMLRSVGDQLQATGQPAGGTRVPPSA